MRTDEANHILGLRVNVWTSMLLFAGAIAYFVLARRRGPREAPETLRDPWDRDDPDDASAGESADDGNGAERESGDADAAGAESEPPARAGESDDSGRDEATAGDERKVERGQ